MYFYIGDIVHVCTIKGDGSFEHLYDAHVVESDDKRVRVLVRKGTYGFWFEQQTGQKIGISSRYITKKIYGWRSIDDI